MKGQHGRAMRDYCHAQHINPGSLLPALLRARLNARLARLEAEEVSVCAFAEWSTRTGGTTER